jgi:drug/metabolite transporter superfamily protein YnfA
MTDAVLSILVLAAFGLFAGAWFVWHKTRETRRAMLMVLLGIIALVNVAIWTVPDAGGDAPIDAIGDVDQGE